MDSIAAAVDSTTTQPKMLKLKLFGGKEKEKKDNVGTPVSSPAPITLRDKMCCSSWSIRDRSSSDHYSTNYTSSDGLKRLLAL
ncbi:unnamed protein product [Heligmosomoides polygyrus]|uniref:Uncharacterized protein n=1 Tax=Heligmosomoides polygyrus TaxID=6339 RepID=A0A183GSJ8_HELPZ|nr:unnamed protein product [Heligmosomoides polygyrus]